MVGEVSRGRNTLIRQLPFLVPLLELGKNLEFDKRLEQMLILARRNAKNCRIKKDSFNSKEGQEFLR